MNIDFSYEHIRKALDFYEIEGGEYRDRCIEAAETVGKESELYDRAAAVWKTLYLGADDDRYALRKNTKEELFGENAPVCMTSLIVLSGVDIHKGNMEKYRFDEEQKHLHIMRVHNVLADDITIRKAKFIRPSQMQWGTNFILAKLIEFGRLQFERWAEKPGVVNMHIPAGAPLDASSVNAALEMGKGGLEYHFGITNPRFECESWLLSREVRAVVDDGSNIAKFYDRFDSHPFEDGREEILDYVFNLDECDDFTLLPEKTSLQRKMKKILIEGKEIFSGEGVFIG